MSEPTLLLVDDERRILSALRRALRREGYRLVEHSCPKQALAWLERESADAILSDHKMPAMSGLELLEAAARLHPRAARLLITGWPEEVSRERMRRAGIRALIPKPWDDAELKRILRDALA